MNDLDPLSPLAFLISVVMDEDAPRADRIAAAQAVLPYLHEPLPPLETTDDDQPVPGLQ